MADEKDKQKGLCMEGNGAWRGNEGVHSEAGVSGWSPNPDPVSQTAPGETSVGGDPQELSPPFLPPEKYNRRPSSSSSSSSSTVSSPSSMTNMASFSSSAQTDVGVDCAGMVLDCLFCRFYDVLATFPTSCERATLCCCPSYKQFASRAEPEAEAQSFDMGCDCGLLDACQDTSECLELAMEISEICYH